MADDECEHCGGTGERFSFDGRLQWTCDCVQTGETMAVQPPEPVEEWDEILGT